jgi:hypothetical protein
VRVAAPVMSVATPPVLTEYTFVPPVAIRTVADACAAYKLNRFAGAPANVEQNVWLPSRFGSDPRFVVTTFRASRHSFLPTRYGAAFVLRPPEKSTTGPGSARTTQGLTNRGSGSPDHIDGTPAFRADVAALHIRLQALHGLAVLALPVVRCLEVVFLAEQPVPGIRDKCVEVVLRDPRRGCHLVGVVGWCGALAEIPEGQACTPGPASDTASGSTRTTRSWWAFRGPWRACRRVPIPRRR